MNESKKPLLDFIKSQKLLVIATGGEDPWIANVYYGADDYFKLYFISSSEERHSRYILANPKITFATTWFNGANYADRKGVQGKGLCRVALRDEDILRGVALHNLNFPDFKKRITSDYIRSTSNTSCVWIIEPTFIKFWNDELYKEKQWQEFEF